MSILVSLLLLCALFYLGGPILIRFNQSMKARPTLDTLDSNRLPPALSEYMYNNAGALRDIGFIPEAYFSLPDAAPGVQSHLIMLTRRATGDKAMVTLMTSPQIMNRYVEFSTRFTSGRSVDTSTIAGPTAFKRLPGEVKTYLPQIKDVSQLYAIHRFVIEQEQAIGPDDAPIMYAPGTAEEYLRTKVFEQGYEEQVGTGLLYRAGSNGDATYCPTWYGAFYMTWKLMFPFKQIEKFRRDQRAKQVLDAFDASGRIATER